MVAHILERCRNHSVEPEMGLAGLTVVCDSECVHSLYRLALHIPVEAQPRSSPSCKSERIVEPATFPAVLEEREMQAAVRRFRGIHPEHE